MAAWTREFARPLPLFTAGLLALNDHVLKGAHVLPGWLTGKLSDVAGLFFFPILLFALTSALLGEVRAERRVARASVLACLTVLVFSAMKVIPSFNALACGLLGHGALDPTDLAACPLAAASVVYLRRAPAGEGPRGENARRIAVVLAAVASLATSAPRYARSFPHWKIDGGAHRRAGCSEVTVEIVKSGKTGLGAIVSHDREPSCEVRIEAARVRIAGMPYRAIAVPAWDEARTAYLGFAFDNEALWNDGVRVGTFELDVSVGGQRTALVFPMTHEWTGPQESVRRGPAPPPSLPVAAPPEPDAPDASESGEPR